MATSVTDRLDGKVALVTGSTRGVGRATADRLADAGAVVVVHGRDRDACESVVSDLGGAIAVAASLDSASSGQLLVEDAVAAAGRLDIVVNNAGVALDNFITGVTDARWDETIATNLTVPFAIMRAAAKVMKEQGEGGAIVNLTSTSGERGNAGQAAYAASKGGLHSVTLTAAKELGRFGIRVNSVSPMVGTEMNGLADPELAAKIGPRLPLGEVADPSHAAEAIAFLVSDRARFITGELIHVDAGFHLA